MNYGYYMFIGHEGRVSMGIANMTNRHELRERAWEIGARVVKRNGDELIEWPHGYGIESAVSSLS